MSLARKLNIADHQKMDHATLQTRLELLKSKGFNDLQIGRDPKVREIKAKIRKARRQMARMEALKLMVAEHAEAKAKKLAAAKEAPAQVKKAQHSETPKKPRKERKPAKDDE
jgi:hypothetical protein